LKNTFFKVTKAELNAVGFSLGNVEAAGADYVSAKFKFMVYEGNGLESIIILLSSWHFIDSCFILFY